MTIKEWMDDNQLPWRERKYKICDLKNIDKDLPKLAEYLEDKERASTNHYWVENIKSLINGGVYLG